MRSGDGEGKKERQMEFQICLQAQLWIGVPQVCGSMPECCNGLLLCSRVGRNNLIHIRAAGFSVVMRWKNMH